MRQFLAATALVALLGLPTAYFLGGVGNADSIAASGAIAAAPEMAEVDNKDMAEVVIEGMHKIATGLEASLAEPEGNGAALTFSFAPPNGTARKAPLIDLVVAARPAVEHGLAGLTGETETVGAPAEVDDSQEPDEVIDSAALDTPVSAPAVVAAVVATGAIVARFRYARFAGVSLERDAMTGILSRAYPTSFYWFDLA